MKHILIELINGKWHFNGQLYAELGGIEKHYIDNMISEVRLETFKAERTPNNLLKRFNHRFSFSGGK